MDIKSYDVDAEPVVQLTDMPITSSPSANHQLPPQNGFDKTKLILPVAILIAAILISGSIIYVQSNNGRDGGSPVEVVKSPPAKVEIDLTDAMILGNADAPVTIVEYGDYQCPFCERYYKQNELSFISKYVNSGKARFVWKDYAFLGPESILAAEASRCANDQGKFWAYHNYLYEKQGAENSEAYSKANLKKFASALGLNTGQFNNCLDSGKYTSFIQKENQAANAIGVNGTPATFINGQLVVDANGNSVGAAPFAVFESIIDKLLAK